MSEKWRVCWESIIDDSHGKSEPIYNREEAERIAKEKDQEDDLIVYWAEPDSVREQE